MVVEFLKELESNGYRHKGIPDFKGPADLLKALQFHVHANGGPVFFPVTYERYDRYVKSKEEADRARNSPEPTKYSTTTSVTIDLPYKDNPDGYHPDRYDVRVEVVEHYLSSEGGRRIVILEETGSFYGPKFENLKMRGNGEAVMQACLGRASLK